ncbi:MAG: gliding motility-associated lipoprotein [Bacteroidia bacterium]|nr:MAG: gliding motility-associated lipoprotein [Bacteroidia bacterium]
MRKLVFLYVAIFALLISSCGKKGANGELVGVGEGKDWFEPNPYGMVFIPGGSFNMGLNDQDITFAHNTQSKTVSVDPFWMDETEITNSEYKQYVYWVRDSIARRLLVAADFEEYKKDLDPEKAMAVDPEYDHDDPETCLLNWDKDVEWDKADEEYQNALADLFLPMHERFYKQKEIDTRKLIFSYQWVDLKQAAENRNKYHFNEDFTGGEYSGSVVNYKGKTVPVKDRSAFIMSAKINAYPDTLVWMRDYTYSYNEPLAKRYFWHEAYNDYPVVGVSWVQANAFCVWRTDLMRNYQKSLKNGTVYQDYRLPTEAEWEYAARGGLALSMYPWGGIYTRNVHGCFIANFKPLRGRYGDDGANRTIEVKKYAPNEYHLYDMAGNVAEWTGDAYDVSAYSYTHDLNPDFRYNAKAEDPPVLKRKVVRGGSWKDVAFYMQVGARGYEYQDTAKSYIGFRCVRSYMGADDYNWGDGNF